MVKSGPQSDSDKDFTRHYGQWTKMQSNPGNAIQSLLVVQRAFAHQ